MDELNRLWRETHPSLGSRTVTLDLRDLTYSDNAGKQALREIVGEASTEMITSSAWTQYLAEELKNGKSTNRTGEGRHGNNA